MGGVMGMRGGGDGVCVCAHACVCVTDREGQMSSVYAVIESSDRGLMRAVILGQRMEYLRQPSLPVWLAG